jgi:hypothetical protein
MIANTSALLEIIAKQHSEQYNLVSKKNQDYSNEGPFENFEATAKYANITIDQAFLFHLVNKMTRAKNLLSKDASVTDEPLEDTLMDMANYANLWLAYRKHGK